MSAFTDISGALDTRMSGYSTANSIDVAWENSNFIPTSGESFIRATYLPANTEPTGYDLASDWHTGIYQLDIFTPLNAGKGEANTHADALGAYFKRGTLLSYGDIVVRITSVSISQGSKDGPYFAKKVFIGCSAFSSAE